VRSAGSSSVLASAAVLSESIQADRHMATSDEKMTWTPILGESVFRFDESDAARQKAMPSLSFENPTLREERIDTSRFQKKAPAFRPRFQVDGDQQEVVFQVSCWILLSNEIVILRILK
jgi:hypothetical protein